MGGGGRTSGTKIFDPQYIAEFLVNSRTPLGRVGASNLLAKPSVSPGSLTDQK